MDSKSLSVIVPVYGVEKYLRRCLDSLCLQLNEETEIIVIDDGSRDACPEICDSYGGIEGVRVIHKENGGLASAVIRGIEEARGKYIGFCDGDDFVAEGYVEGVTEVIREKNPDVIYFDYYRLDEEEKVKKAVRSVDISSSYYKGGECEKIRKLYMRDGGISPCRWNKVIRRKYVNMTLEYYDERAKIGEDILFTAPIIYTMESFYYIGKPLINYNVNEGSMTVNFTSSYVDNYYLVFDCLSKFFVNGSVFLGYIHYINMRTLVNCISRSRIKNKREYLKSVLSSVEFKERLRGTDKNSLSLPNKTLLLFMKREWALPLLSVAYAYRGIKWLR